MHKDREISLQKIIEATAIARIHRAQGGITSTAGEQLDFKAG